MENKKRNSNLIPYKIREGRVFVYLQKRTSDAPHLPGYFAFWGGSAEEGENPEDTIRREIKEEINYIPEGIAHFKEYRFEQRIKDIFIVEVGDDFDSRVKILEGEYGKWFSEQEALNESKLIEEHRGILFEFYNLIRLRGKR